MSYARTNVSPWRDVMAPQFDLLAEVLRFFDEHLLGKTTGLTNESPIHYFNMHAEQWAASIVDYYPDWAERCASMFGFDTTPYADATAVVGHPVAGLRISID
ncbi:Putative serine esterase [Pandoraea eparura]|uniref:Serine esterase n=1 Tax=Pandoraea eparura TaxID=2508291 RepID=A0A5E4U6L0_9BURK|nr:hypothetical protein [Pandoraea eparura]VVD95122.1 Putative serine esterase [Pandoraea eparura]